MSQPMDRAGDFRGKIVSYQLETFRTGNTGLRVKLAVEDWWDGSAWVDWREYRMECDGVIFLGKADGTLNERTVASLVSDAGWDGSFSSLGNQQWVPAPVGFSTKETVYENRTSYQLQYLKPYENNGSANAVKPDQFAALDAKWGSQIRAIAGNVKRNSTAPATQKPAAPPPRPKQDPPAVPASADKDDVPF